MPIYKTNEKGPDGLTKYRVRINYTDGAGKAHSLTRIAYGYTNAKQLESELMNQYQNGTQQSMTLNRLYTDYMRTMKNELRESSLAIKEKIFRNHITPYLGKFALSKLTVKALTEWKNTISEKELSLTTKKNIYTELRACLNYGVKLGYTQSNPLDKVGDFKDSYSVKKDMDFYTPEEFMIYKHTAEAKYAQNGLWDYYVFFMLAYYTGARKGEIHALRWNNLNGDTLSIRSSISQKIKGQRFTETPPKNKSSIRDIVIPPVLMEILTTHREYQQRLIPDWDSSGFIVGYYHPLSDTQIDNQNREIAQLAGLHRIRIHDFRHSLASLLINNNINPLEVSKILGHSTVEQTLNTYSHLFPDEHSKSLAILDKIR